MLNQSINIFSILFLMSCPLPNISCAHMHLHINKKNYKWCQNHDSAKLNFQQKALANGEGVMMAGNEEENVDVRARKWRNRGRGRCSTPIKNSLKLTLGAWERGKAWVSITAKQRRGTEGPQQRRSGERQLPRRESDRGERVKMKCGPTVYTWRINEWSREWLTWNNGPI